MGYIIDIKSSDLIDVIEKLLNSSGVKIKTDFDINFSAPDLSTGLDFSEHDAKIKKEMEHEVQWLMEENARLEKKRKYRHSEQPHETLQRYQRRNQGIKRNSKEIRGR